MSALDVTVPDIGDFTDIPVISILVGVGDSVSAEDPLIELESDKATMEVPSPHAGVVERLLVKVGDKIKPGEKIALMGSSGRSTTSSTNSSTRNFSG